MGLRAAGSPSHPQSSCGPGCLCSVFALSLLCLLQPFCLSPLSLSPPSLSLSPVSFLLCFLFSPPLSLCPSVSLCLAVCLCPLPCPHPLPRPPSLSLLPTVLYPLLCISAPAAPPHRTSAGSLCPPPSPHPGLGSLSVRSPCVSFSLLPALLPPSSSSCLLAPAFSFPLAAPPSLPLLSPEAPPGSLPPALACSLRPLCPAHPPPALPPPWSPSPSHLPPLPAGRCPPPCPSVAQRPGAGVTEW